ncbi:OprO/OprP family phosphate-selective porin [Govanella unica]|uniref:OprO/OprP family phosphate-selective porin n=1 Tax=Govanella unica TaxID=2975056 RepID=A0A9X3TX81_9PROT|nr:porin [Govania unica]MDA5193408.1 OprO/OprP family phosphate-selective porin [Govania unica]
MRRSIYAQKILTHTALAGGLFLALTGGAQADDTALLNRLQVLEDTIKALQSELAAVKAEAQAAHVQAGQAAQAQVASAKTGTKIDFKPSPSFTSEDGSASFKIRGRIQTDAAVYHVREGDTSFANGTDLRALWFGFEGSFANDWSYYAEADFSKGGRSDGAEIDVKNAYIQYRGFKNTKITAGQHKVPLSFEQLTSSGQLTFLERPTPVNAFTDRVTASGDYKLGLSTAYAARNWTVAGGLFGENSSVLGSGRANEGWGVAGRITAAPIQEPGKVLHLGASGSWRKVQSNGSVRFRDRPELAIDSSPTARLIDTGPISADDYVFAGAELGGIWGPITVQSEYLWTRVNQNQPNLSSVSFDGAYVQLSWLLTGERRGYKDGLFARVQPTRDFSLKNGGTGAFELSGRFDTTDLNDANIRGGTEDNYTLGLTWYANSYVKTQVNWVRFDANKAGVVTKGDAVAVRFAIDW